MFRLKIVSAGILHSPSPSLKKICSYLFDCPQKETDKGKESDRRKEKQEIRRSQSTRQRREKSRSVVEQEEVARHAKFLYINTPLHLPFCVVRYCVFQ